MIEIGKIGSPRPSDKKVEAEAPQKSARTDRKPTKPIEYLEGTNLEMVLEQLVPPTESEKQRQEMERAARHLIDQMTTVGEAKFDDKFNYERWSNHFSKMWFALLERDEEHFAAAVKGLHEENRKMGEKRDREYQKIIDHINRSKWWDLLGMAGSALGGAAAAAALGSGVGAVVVSIATVALILLSVDSILGDKGKEFIASIGAGGDDTLIKQRTALLKTAATFAILGANLINIVAAGTAVPANAWGLLNRGAALFGGATQLASAADRAQNAFHEKERTRWHLEIEQNQDKMKELHQVLTETMEYLALYRKMRRDTADSHHQAIVGLMR